MLHEGLDAFYSDRAYQPAWINEEGAISDQAWSLLAALDHASAHGLNSQKYHVDHLDHLLATRKNHLPFQSLYEPLRIAMLDLLLSNAFMHYAAHLTGGQVDPQLVHVGEWKARPRRADVISILRFSLEHRRVKEALADMVPSYSGYTRLLNALERYRQIADKGGWLQIPTGPLLRVGAIDPRVPILRDRLWMTGDLAVLPPNGGNVLDAETGRALKRFQTRHGLIADKILGPRTLAALNRPVEDRIRQLELNLERWRWLPKDFGKRYLLVNISDFSLQVIENDHLVMSMPVVVGSSYRKTPVFSETMTYLEFAPYWGVPETILEEDKLPRIRADIGFIERHNYEIIPWHGPAWARIDPRDIDWDTVTADEFPGLLRMRPGPWNPLGQIKFMFPNEFDIYLHDTSDPHLFDKRERTFSSGCIRVERPVDLAQYLLEGDSEWDCNRLLGLFNAPEPERVDLKNPMPVHLLYWTAWVDERGAVQFRQDIYQRDVDLDYALQHQRYVYRYAQLQQGSRSKAVH